MALLHGRFLVLGPLGGRSFLAQPGATFANDRRFRSRAPLGREVGVRHSGTAAGEHAGAWRLFTVGFSLRGRLGTTFSCATRRNWAQPGAIFLIEPRLRERGCDPDVSRCAAGTVDRIGTEPDRHRAPALGRCVHGRFVLFGPIATAVFTRNKVQLLQLIRIFAVVRAVRAFVGAIRTLMPTACADGQGTRARGGGPPLSFTP